MKTKQYTLLSVILKRYYGINKWK